MIEPIELTGAYLNVPKKTYVWAERSPSYRATYDRVRTDPSWTTITIPAGHMLMAEAPGRAAEILETAI